MSKETEREVERHLYRRVQESLGGVCVKMSPAGQAGWPDRVILLPGGRAAFAELKCLEGRPAKIQVERLKRLEALGFKAELLWSKAEVDEFVDELAAWSCA